MKANIYISEEQALNIYKEAKKIYLEDMSEKKWFEFCNAIRTCFFIRYNVIITILIVRK